MSKYKTMCCSVCKKDNITWRVWVDENNNIKGDCADWDGYAYCDDCEDETTAILKEKEDES